MDKIDLKSLFNRRLVMDMQTLQKVCGRSRSPRSLFRDLCSEGYLSSYSHAGKYFTLKDIPQFDEHGLWVYGNVNAFFSKYGTLKNTLSVLIQNSTQGLTLREASRILRVRVQNALNDLLRTKKISRERTADIFIYLSKNKKIAEKQMRRRQKAITPSITARKKSTQVTYLDRSTTIEILLELLRSDDWHPRRVAARLRTLGMAVLPSGVSEILIRYGLKKRHS